MFYFPDVAPHICSDVTFPKGQQTLRVIFLFTFSFRMGDKRSEWRRDGRTGFSLSKGREQNQLYCCIAMCKSAFIAAIAQQHGSTTPKVRVLIAFQLYWPETSDTIYSPAPAAAVFEAHGSL